jgi:hypothetical protein
VSTAEDEDLRGRAAAAVEVAGASVVHLQDRAAAGRAFARTDGDESGDADSPEPTPPAGFCAPPVPEPTSVDVSFFEGERVDGVRYWGGTANYVLTSGDIGEARLLVDSDGVGEASFAINDQIVAHAAITNDGDNCGYDGVDAGPSVQTWSSADLGYSADLLAELLQTEVAVDMINGMVPQEFKCSPFGRKAVKAAKYLWVGAVAAAGTTCCAASSGVGCALCIGGAAAASQAGVDAANGYCE